MNDNIVKRTSSFIIKPSHSLFEYCDEITFNAKNLKNSANYHMRQCFIFYDKDNLSDKTKQYFDEMNKYIDEFNKKSEDLFKKKKEKKIEELKTKLKDNNLNDDDKKKITKELKKWKDKKYIGQPNISKDSGLLFYNFLDYYYKCCFKSNEYSNPYKDLPTQAAQQVLRNLSKDWKSFFASIKDFSENPSKYTGKPELPKYKKKNGRCKISLTNQQCKITDKGYLKLPYTKKLLKIGFDINDLILKEVRIVPMGTIYKIEIVWDTHTKKISNLKEDAIIGIDLGVNNFATITNNIGLDPIIIDGKPLKCINQYYNKIKAELQEKLPFAKNFKNEMRQLSWSKTLDKLTKNRNLKIDDSMHKISKYIIKYCIDNNIGTIVIGYNNTWKENLHMGKTKETQQKNHQNFVQIPFKTFINKMLYKAEMIGINVIVREESYTSKASFIDLDDIPTFNKNNKNTYKFSGVRKHRGLYVSKNGKQINADINGSYNIIRKEFPHLFTKEIISNLKFHAKKIIID